MNQRRRGAFHGTSAGRDRWFHELMQDAAADCPPEPMDSEDMLYILYTSGTTGKPKGIVHTTGGFLPAATRRRNGFLICEDDVYWCTADIGWVTGHSYVVYGPLANGATVMMYEGAPDWPEGSLLEDDQEHSVTIFYTAPTAIRAFMKWGTWPARRNLSSLRLLGSVGEPINPEAWMWYQEHIGRRSVRSSIRGGRPRPDNSDFAAAGLTRYKPGSATHPSRESRRMRTADGSASRRRRPPRAHEAVAGHAARHLRRPRALRAAYWTKWEEDVYFTGDGARVDKDGYYWLLGRVDDVLNVAGHRIGTMEVESALVDHPKVAEAAVVGRPHEIKGQAVAAFVTLKEGATGRPRSSTSSRSTSSGRSAPWRGRTRSCLPPTCPRRGPARSCAGCCATSPKARRWATRPRWPTPMSSPG